MTKIDRKATTKALLDLTVQKASKQSVYGAGEVAIDWGTVHPRYIDYMTFSPAGTIYASQIEKGIFTCYEIKSCYEDLYSGKGLNFIGEKNYIVTTMSVYKRIIEDMHSDKIQDHIKACNPESKCRVGHDVGVLVTVPDGKTLEEEFNSPTEFDPSGKYRLEYVMKCHETARKRSLIELMFAMMKALSFGR